MQKATQRSIGGDQKLVSGIISRGSRVGTWILLSYTMLNKFLGLDFKFVDNSHVVSLQRNENAKKKEEFVGNNKEYRVMRNF